jgi:hypothetical protein
MLRICSISMPLAGGGTGRDAMTAIGAPDRLGDRKLIGRQILARDQAAIPGEVGGDLLGELALVEQLRPALGQTLQRIGHVGIGEQIADALQAAIGPEIQVLAGLAVAQFVDGVDLATALLILRPEPVHMRAHQHAAPRLRDRRRNHIGPVHRAEARERIVIALDAAGRADGEMAELADATFEQEGEAVARLAEQFVDPHVGRRRERGFCVELDDLVDAAAGHVELHRAEAADARHQRVDHALHEGAGDAASTALPPRSSTAAPASAASGCGQTIIPFFMVMCLRPLP